MTEEFKKLNEQSSDKDLTNGVLTRSIEIEECEPLLKHRQDTTEISVVSEKKNNNKFTKKKKVLISVSVIVGILIAVAVAVTIISPENSIISLVKNTVKKENKIFYYIDGTEYYHSSNDCEQFKLDQITGYYFREETAEEIKTLFKDAAPCPECVD